MTWVQVKSCWAWHVTDATPAREVHEEVNQTFVGINTVEILDASLFPASHH